MGGTIVILHGPSLSLLGTREPEVYGHLTLDEIVKHAAAEAAAHGMTVHALQTNHEGVLIDEILGAKATGAKGVVLNAGAYAHTSLALADAIRAVAPLPVIEVHLTNTAARDAVRREAPVGAACAGRIEGLGGLGLSLAVRAIALRPG